MAEYDRITHRLQADSCVRIGFTDPGDEFILLAGHVERRPVEAFGLPIRGESGYDDDSIRLCRQLLSRDQSILRVNLLTPSKSLFVERNECHHSVGVK